MSFTSFKQRLDVIFEQIQHHFYRLPQIPRDCSVTFLFLCGAYYISSILISHTGGENNSALVFVLAVAFVSLITTGYLYGIVASVAGTFFINVYFMYP